MCNGQLLETCCRLDLIRSDRPPLPMTSILDWPGKGNPEKMTGAACWGEEVLSVQFSVFSFQWMVDGGWWMVDGGWWMDSDRSGGPGGWMKRIRCLRPDSLRFAWQHRSLILNPSGPLLPRSSRGRRAGDEGAAPSKTRSRPLGSTSDGATSAASGRMANATRIAPSPPTPLPRKPGERGGRTVRIWACSVGGGGRMKVNSGD